jgi:hypothetical protein
MANQLIQMILLKKKKQKKNNGLYSCRIISSSNDMIPSCTLSVIDVAEENTKVVYKFSKIEA